MALGGSARLRLNFSPPGHKPRSVSTGAQFVFSSDSLIKFMLGFDPIFLLWQETHDREVDIGDQCAERCTDILYQLTKAKFMRHVLDFYCGCGETNGRLLN